MLLAQVISGPSLSPCHKRDSSCEVDLSIVKAWQRSSVCCVSCLSGSTVLSCAVRFQALLHHLVGRAWRRRLDSECPAEVQHLLAWFLDQPASRHAFSIHAICAAGRGTECAL